MTRYTTLAVLGVRLLGGERPPCAQNWKGLGRLEGRVVDADGKALPDVTLKLELPTRGGGTSVKTDKKGRWAIGEIAAGKWNIDVDAPGFVARHVSIDLPNEGARLPPVELKLDRAAPQGPAPAVLEAVNKGDEAYKAGRYAEARAEYEKVLAMRPDLADSPPPDRAVSASGRMIGNGALVPSPPIPPTALRLLMPRRPSRAGSWPRARAAKGVDESAVKDPNVYFNVAALLLNQQKTEEAIGYLSRAIALDPAYVDGYFQRGLAYVGLGRTAEAKADLQKVIELAPGSAQADTARKGLAQIK